MQVWAVKVCGLCPCRRWWWMLLQKGAQKCLGKRKDKSIYCLDPASQIAWMQRSVTYQQQESTSRKLLYSKISESDFFLCVFIAQSCPTLCNTMDLPVSSVHGILKSRKLLYSKNSNFWFFSLCVSCSVMFNSLQHCGPPVSSIHGILQARMLEWVVISLNL